MKKELTLGAPSVPVLRIDAERFRKLLNRVLPAECQVKNATDCWYVGANTAAVHYTLENIDNLRHLLCLVREFFTETGMLPAEIAYHGRRLRYDPVAANAVIKGALDEDAYIGRNGLE